MKVFGNSTFRPRQLEIIRAVMRGEDDIFVIMPTGGGKSLLYQLPAVLTEGVTVVISPLLSLIEDQVNHLLTLPSGGVPAAYLCSTNSAQSAAQVLQDLRRAQHGEEPRLKLLYLTPERIVKSNETRAILDCLYQNELLARFVIDEAHCDYVNLSMLKEHFPETKIMALTATARSAVAADVKKILGMEACLSFQTGWDRPNLFFSVRDKAALPEDARKQVLHYIKASGRQMHTGIVYNLTRDDTMQMAKYLRDNGVQADYYHAGMGIKDRKNVQSAWTTGHIKVVCATIAYGMGIDKPDVRYVVHASLAKSLEGYYQEAGRAGRDDGHSECVIFFRPEDARRQAQIMRMGGKRISKKDQNRLEEMVDYCQEADSCRRNVFRRIFAEPTAAANGLKRRGGGSGGSSGGGGGRGGHGRCSMCDNCRTPVSDVVVLDGSDDEKAEEVVGNDNVEEVGGGGPQRKRGKLSYRGSSRASAFVAASALNSAAGEKSVSTKLRGAVFESASRMLKHGHL